MKAALTRRPGLSEALIVAGLVLGAAVFHTIAVRGVKAPQILCDEFIHAGIADSLVRHGTYAYRGEPLRYSYTYPLALAPAWSIGTMKSTFELTKATNALLMSLAAVPVFLWTRRLASFGWSLGAAVLVLCMPAFAFAGLVMTENIAFPTFVLALYLIAFALERPTVPRQVLALSAIGLASISRYQSLILLPVFVGAAFVKLGPRLACRSPAGRAPPPGAPPGRRGRDRARPGRPLPRLEAREPPAPVERPRPVPGARVGEVPVAGRGALDGPERGRVGDRDGLPRRRGACPAHVGRGRGSASH